MYIFLKNNILQEERFNKSSNALLHITRFKGLEKKDFI